jgi:hypothetical protein
MLLDKACFERGCACYDDRVDSEPVEVIRKEWIGLTEYQKLRFAEKFRIDTFAVEEIEEKLKEKNS